MRYGCRSRGRAGEALPRYLSLIAAAEQCALPRIKHAWEQSLKEERAMARAIEEAIPEVTRTYLRDPRAAA